VILCLPLLFLACKSKEKIATEKKLLKNKNVNTLLEEMQQAYYSYDWLSAKANVTIKGAKVNNSFKANLRMKSDSLIWISFSSLGIEAARVLLTQDTVKVINRLAQEYFVGTYDYISEAFKVEADFSSIQKIISGRAIEEERDEDKLKSFENDNKYLISGLKAKKLNKWIEKEKGSKINRVYSLWLNPDNFKIEKQAYYDFNTNENFSITYKNFIENNKKLMPENAAISLTGENEIDVNISFYGFDFEQPKSISFKIPEKYARIF
jgi:hypothetical protein